MIRALSIAEKPKYTGKCHLLNLPRELRDAIIEETLVGYQNDRDTLIMTLMDTRDFKQPALACVNKQLRCETLEMFYDKKTFSIISVNKDEQFQRMKNWLCAIEQHLHMIKRITMSLCDDNVTVLELKAAPGQMAKWDMDCHESWTDADLMEVCHAVVVLNNELKLGQKLQVICDSVGDAGFGVSDYVHAPHLFLFPEERCCEGDPPTGYPDELPYGYDNGYDISWPDFEGYSDDHGVSGGGVLDDNDEDDWA